MKLFRGRFSKETAGKDSEDVMRISNKIGPLIEETVKQVFASFGRRLLSEPVTYIVPAVWGASKEGDLTELQKEINGQIAPVVKEIITGLEFKGLRPAQEFALGFIIRGLFVSRIIYMLEAVKAQIADHSGQGETGPLDSLDPIGNA